jgi:ubiquinol-cytochrome c reductase cytochrome c subunit
VSSATIRRSRWAAIIAMIAALFAVGAVYTVVKSSAKATAASSAQTSALIEEGRALFLTGCSSCHGLNAEGIDASTVNNGGNGGPSLIGVGSAAVHFQVSTGRMPLAGPEAQAPAKESEYTPEQIEALSAYIASLGPGPASPTEADLDFSDASLAEGGELFRTNCSQCHNFSGRGGALSDGAYAPSLMNSTPQQIWEAMITGPQQMPVFSNETLTPDDKRAIIAYIEELRTAPNPGGQDLGSLGPVTEGLFTFVVGIGLFVAVAVWIGAKVR